MKLTKPAPPQELRLTVPADTLAALKGYQRYQQEVEGARWELKEMAVAILTLYLAEGDPRFLAWRKRQPSHASTAQGNGATEGSST